MTDAMLLPAEGVVSAETYMTTYAPQRYEWVKGSLIKMSPITLQHYMLVNYIEWLLEAYFELNPIGQVIGEPMVMVLEATESRREPDLQVILRTNPGQLTDTAMLGAADICIEVVSKGSVSVDHGEKFEEYEVGGVQEYWIIDPIRQSCRFNRLQGDVYHTLEVGDFYTTPLLPHFRLHIATLWQEKLPGLLTIEPTVRAMFEG